MMVGNGPLAHSPKRLGSGRPALLLWGHCRAKQVMISSFSLP